MNGINIFYADDDEDDLMFFNDAFETISKNFKKLNRLHIHKNGENLLETIKVNKLDTNVVVLDINMPMKTGFQLLEEIRKDNEIKKVPVIIYSTSSNTKDILLSQDLGANFYAVKPYDFNDLKKMIACIIHINWRIQEPNFNNFLFNKLIISEDLI